LETTPVKSRNAGLKKSAESSVRADQVIVKNAVVNDPGLRRAKASDDFAHFRGDEDPADNIP
jgi:hypothetical protein